MKKRFAIAIAAALSFSLMGCTKTEAAPGTSAAVAPKETTQAVAPMESASVTEITVAAASSGTKATAAAGSITADQALEIAYQHAGVKAEDVQFHRVQLETDDGVQEYDVNFFIQGKEYDYDISPTTGEIRSFDYEVEDHAWTGTAGGSQAVPITIEDAKRLALDRVQGANESNLRIKTDMDDGRTIYEGKIIYNNTEYEFEIDAATGTFLEWDSESAFD